MIWFISACLFFLFRFYLPDFGGVLTLGTILPLLFFHRSLLGAQPNQDPKDGFLLVFLGCVFLFASIWGAMPEEVLDLVALVLVISLILRSRPFQIEFLAILTIPILGWGYFWFSDGKLPELILLSIVLIYRHKGSILIRYLAGSIFLFLLLLFYLLEANLLTGQFLMGKYPNTLGVRLGIFLSITHLLWIGLSQVQSLRKTLLDFCIFAGIYAVNILYFDPTFSIFLFFSSLPREGETGTID